MNTFKLTDEAHHLMVNALSEEGLLDVQIERRRNDLHISLWHNHHKIYELDPVTVESGDILRLERMKAIVTFPKG